MKTLRFYVSAIFLMTFILTFSAYAAGEGADLPWPQFQHDMFHTNSSIFCGPNIQRTTTKFQEDIGAGFSSPVIDSSGVVYIGSTDGCIYALAPSGQSRCIYNIDSSIESSLAISHDATLYFGSVEGNLYAITPYGDLRWGPLRLGDSITASITVDPHGKVFVTAAEKAQDWLYCVSPEGDILWRYPIGNVTYSSPALDRFGNIYIGSSLGTVYALNSNGLLLWSYDTDDTIDSSPVIAQNGSILVTTTSALIALTNKGELKWTFIPTAIIWGAEEVSQFASSPALGPDGKIYAGGINGDLHCLEDKGDKAHVVWSVMLEESSLSHPVPPFILSPPVVDSCGTLYVRAQDISVSFLNPDEQATTRLVLYAISSSDGTIRGAVQVSPQIILDMLPLDFSTGMALGANRTLYISSANGILYGVGPEGPSFSLSGHINGEELQDMLVHIQGAEQRTIAVQDTGEYSFDFLLPGSYIVTPVKQGLRFEPPSQQARLWYADIDGVDFASQVAGPYFVTAQAHPSPVPNDGASSVLFSAEVTHLKGQQFIDSVYADLAPVNGSTEQSLHDDGTNGDVVAGDGIYSYAVVVDSQVPIGPKAIVTVATDVDGLSAQTVIELGIISMITSTVSITGTATQQHEIFNDIEGQRLDLSYYLPGALTETRVVASEASDEDMGVVLDIFKPSNSTGEPDFTDNIQSAITSLEFEDAEVGRWVYRVTNRSTVSRQYHIKTTTAGTGIVFGNVMDAETGELLDSVAVTTSVGGAGTTQEGYYLLLSPTGVFTISASDTEHVPASKSVTLMSGESVEVNMLLSPDLGEDTACLLETTCSHRRDVVALLRDFRDVFLQKTFSGRQYIKAYYQHAPEVAAIVKADAALQREIFNIVLELVPIIKTMLEGKPAVMPAPLSGQLKTCLQRIRAASSNSLKKSIDILMSDLDNALFLKKLYK